MSRSATCRRHQREVGRFVDKREIAADVALHQRPCRLSDALNELTEGIVGEILVRR